MTDLSAIQNDNEMREALRELARKGKLSVTELLALPARQKEMAGMMILGQVWQTVPSDFGYQLNCIDAGSFDEELQAYRVKVEGINATLDPDNPDRNKLKLVLGTETKHMRASKRGAEFEMPSAMVKDKIRVIELDKDHCAEISLADAWLLLKQCGEQCCYAKSREYRKSAWLCRELPSKARRGA